jgi:hypothetical protein
LGQAAFIATNEVGNGNIIEIAKLIPKDIPSHNIWLRINFLLLELILSPNTVRWLTN